MILGFELGSPLIAISAVWIGSLGDPFVDLELDDQLFAPIPTAIIATGVKTGFLSQN